MKIRPGFVSNSSSSSFLIFIHISGLPASVDDILKATWGVTPDVVCPDQYHDNAYTYREVAEALFEDLHDITNDKEARQSFFHELSNMMDVVRAVPHVAVLPQKDYDKLEKQLMVINRIYRRKMLTALFSRVDDGDFRVYRVEYCDECGGFGSLMEHGDHWDRLEWTIIQFRHH
jgi:hypothetical protein